MSRMERGHPPVVSSTEHCYAATLQIRATIRVVKASPVVTGTAHPESSMNIPHTRLLESIKANVKCSLAAAAFSLFRLSAP